MKTFMAVWAVMQRFRAFFSVGILTSVPFINVIATWSYGGNKLEGGSAIQRRMNENLRAGYGAFDNFTKNSWHTLLSETIVVLVFTLISVSVNRYVYATWPSNFDKVEWFATYNLVHWYEVAAWGISIFMIMSSVVSRFNAIYQSHRNWDPEYMEEVSPKYLAERNSRIIERETQHAAK